MPCLNCGKTSQAGSHRCALGDRLSVLQSRCLCRSWRQPRWKSRARAAIRVIQERGQGRLFSLLGSSADSSTGTIQSEGLSNHGNGNLLVLNSSNFLSRRFLSNCGRASAAGASSLGVSYSERWQRWPGLLPYLRRALQSPRRMPRLPQRLILRLCSVSGSGIHRRPSRRNRARIRFNRRKLSLGRLGGRLVGSFSNLLYIVLHLPESSRPTPSGTGCRKTPQQSQTHGRPLQQSQLQALQQLRQPHGLVRSLLLGSSASTHSIASRSPSIRSNALNNNSGAVLRGSLAASATSPAQTAVPSSRKLTEWSGRPPYPGQCVNTRSRPYLGAGSGRPPRDSRLRRPAEPSIVQCHHGCEPVNAGHNNAGFDLATAVQQTMHVLINLAQFQAHGARTAGTHELPQEAVGHTAP